MTVTDKYGRVSPQSITVHADRQRSALELDEAFLASIKQRGILSPLLVTSAHVLVAGGRRHAASVQLGLPDVPVRYVEDGLSEVDVEIIELEENIARRDLPWQDTALAISRVHELYRRREPDWTRQKMSVVLGLSQGQTTVYLRVAQALRDPKEHEKIDKAPTVRGAYNVCTRIDDRVADAALEDITFGIEELAGEDENGNEEPTQSTGGAPAQRLPVEGGEQLVTQAGAVAVVSPPLLQGAQMRTALKRQSAESPIDVLCGDFAAWAQTYSGPRFNFVHADFPYGKRVFGGEWGGKNAEEDFKYDDDPEVYWHLCSVLADNIERICTPTAHLMFWTSSEVENLWKTIQFFRERTPSFIFQERALTWHKSDNVGIVPDPLRGPRWICETALMASRGDRPLVKPLASSYSAPTARSLHPSAKPEPVLRHFFGMFVDGTTRMLDPTCGAGSSLRAAESLGASHVFGIEQSPEYATSARRALESFRQLRELSK